MGVCVYVKEAYKTEKYVYFFDYITANVVCMLFTVAIRAIEIFVRVNLDITNNFWHPRVHD